MKTLARSAQQAIPARTPAPLREPPRRLEQNVPDLSHLAPAPTMPDARAPGDPRDAEKARFLRDLRHAITDAVTADLGGTGWTAEQCPYLDYWFAYYQARSTDDVERALRKYAAGAGDVSTLDAYVAPTVARVRAAVARWKATGEIDAPAVDVSDVHVQLAELGPGEPLDSATRTRFESALETDLSKTRIHRDARSAAATARVDAHAFSVGNHIAFDAGEYAPGTLRGDAMLAHELLHTIQQSRGAAADVRDDRALEQNADTAASSALARLWGGVRTGLRAVASSGLQLQRCKGTAKAPDDLSKLTVEQKAAWITRAMDQDLYDADVEIVKVFQTVKTPVELKQLQKLVDMKRVLKFESNFGVAMIAAVGPLLEGDDIVMEKWTSLIIDESDYFVPTTEPFVHYFFMRMATDHMRTVLGKLADRGKLASSIGQMPSVMDLVKKRGIDLGTFVDRTGSGPRKFSRGVWTALKSAAKGKELSEHEKTHKYMNQLKWSEVLPPVYKKWRDDVDRAAMNEFMTELTKPSNLILGEFDYATFGVPVGAYHLVVGTGKGIYHLGTGDYEQAGAELTGALIVLATYASGKVFRMVRPPAPTVAAGAGVIEVATTAAAADELALSAEGEAVTQRLYSKLGPERVVRVARYIQDDSAAARFALENEEAGLYALDEAKGNVAAAEKALPEIQRELAAEQTAAAEAKAAQPAPPATPTAKPPAEAPPPEPTEAPKQQKPAPATPKTVPPPAKPPHVSGKTKAEFVAEYKRLNPKTSYTKAQLEALYDENRYVINPQSGLLNDVNAGKFGPPQHRADYVRDAANKPVTQTIPRDKVPADLETKAQALAEQRRGRLKAAKDARTRAAAAVENEAQAAKDARLAAEAEVENEAMQQARLASKELGEDAAEEFGKRFEDQGLTKTKGAGAGDFDFTYTRNASEEAAVLEAKGGESGLGTRYGVDGVTRVEQGTAEYARAVIEDIKKRDPVRAGQLSKALDAGKLKYYVVRQTVTAAGELGPIEIMEFKL